MRIIQEQKSVRRKPHWLAVGTRYGRNFTIAAVCAGCVMEQGFCDDSSDLVLDLFLKKGLVTEEEVAKVKAEAATLRNDQPAMVPTESKWKIGSAVENLEFFGDVRTRYEYRDAEDPLGGSIQLQRLRYSVRLGLRGEVLDNFYFGLRLDTGANPRSSWLTLGTSASGSNPYQGPFGKSTAGMNLGQAYIGWRPADWVDVTIGKMANPIYTTPMVWDSDLNPEGLTERFKYTVGKADFFATFGQYLYQDTNPTKTTAGYFNIAFTDSNLPFLLAWQGGVNFHITKDASLKVAPVLYNYTGFGKTPTLAPTEVPGFDGVYVGEGTTNNLTGGNYGPGPSGFPSGPANGFAANQTGIRDLMIVELPLELLYRWTNSNVKVFGDYATNLRGADRARAAAKASANPVLVGVGPIETPQTKDTHAYQIGVAFGNMESWNAITGSQPKHNLWELRTYWQHAEQYSLDPNLIDSDFFEGRLNMEGVCASLTYGFNQSVFATARYGYARRINDKLGTGGSNQDIPQMNPIEHFNLFQVDLTCRF